MPHARCVRGCHCEQDRQRARGRGGQPRGLRLPICAAHLPALERGLRRRDRPRVHRVPRRFLDRREHRHRPRHRQRRARHPVRVGHHRHRGRARRLLRRPLQPRPRPHRPWLGIRLLRLDDHDRGLRGLHLYLLRPGGRHHGAGAAGGDGDAAVARLSHLDRGRDPDRHLRHACAGAPAFLDHAPVARPRPAAAAVDPRLRPRGGARLHVVHRQLRRLDQLRRRCLERGRVLRPHPAAGGADRLHPRHAAAHAVERPLVVDVVRVRPARAGSSSAAPSR